MADEDLGPHDRSPLYPADSDLQQRYSTRPLHRKDRTVIRSLATASNDHANDATHIATGSYDRSLRLWDAQTHNEIGVIGLHRDRITDIEWMPTGDQVLTASFDGTARIWPVDIDLDDLRARARTRAYRSLTSEERSAHLLPAH